MNPLVGFGGSIDCGEMKIFCGNCRKHRAKRSFWKHCSMKFGGSLARKAGFGSLFSVKFGRSLARNDHFGSFFCENCRTYHAKRSFWKLVLSEASRETFVLEASSVKFPGSLA